MSLRAPLGRALGLGSAKSGFGHWWGQRLSAAALVPLGLWLAVSLASLPSIDYWAVSAWVGTPLNAILLLLLLLTLFHHSRLGLQVVIEDYVHGTPKVVTLALVGFLHAVLAVAGVYAIIKVSLGGQA